MIAALIAAAALNAASLTMPDMPLHDPFILADKASRTYYLYTSNNPRLSGVCGLGTMAYESHDLEHWAAPKAVFTLPKGTWADGGAWAPEAHEWRGRYYLFTTFH
ncbi:MAG TPA: family 43 glycosylhydrolase, partial [Asticcacaulis sp.]